MASPPGGMSLGAARGSITVDASQLRSARAAVRDFATGVNTDLTGINRGAQEAARGFARVDSGARKASRGIIQARDASQELARALGIVGGAVGAVQFGRFVVASDAAATAYRRQSVAAVQLAGSQEKLNELLEAYERGTGGAVDRATSLADVTRLQAVGFANSAEELERFVRAARGSSIAMGRLQAEMSQEIQLAISNQSIRRLDQIGLGVSEVNSRIAELRESNRGMTREAAFQEAVLGLLNEKFGALVDSTEGAATGAEKAGRAWKDARLAFGELTGPAVGFIGNAVTGWLEDATRHGYAVRDAVNSIGAAIRDLPTTPPTFMRLLAEAAAGGRATPFGSGAGGFGSGGGGGGFGGGGARFSTEETSLIRDWSDAVQDIERDANRARIDATQQFAEQRTKTISQYERTIAREAEDFGRQRARAEREFAASIVDVREKAAEREAKQADDLARANAQASVDTDERIADMREDATKRLTEVEEGYQRDRERAAAQHRDNLLSAASRLDARAVAEEQRRFARESADAAEAHEDQRDDLQEQLAERIADEEESLEKSNRQRQDNYERQIREQRAADDRRIQDMRDDFAEQKRVEDEDRAVRLGRMAVDHEEQLAEQARQHGLRLQQISRQAADERDRLDEEFMHALDDQDIRIERWSEQQEKLTDRAIQNFDKWWDHVNKVFGERPLPSTGGAARGLPEMIPAFQQGGFVPRDMLAYLHAGETVTPAGASSGMAGTQITIADGAFQISAPGGDATGIAIAVRQEFESMLRTLS